MPPDRFVEIGEVEIVPSELSAMSYVDGEARRSPVFHKTGEYLIYLDLETEPENTVSFQTTVYYFDEDRKQ